MLTIYQLTGNIKRVPVDSQMQHVTLSERDGAKKENTHPSEY